MIFNNDHRKKSVVPRSALLPILLDVLLLLFELIVCTITVRLHYEQHAPHLVPIVIFFPIVAIIVNGMVTAIVTTLNPRP